MVAVFCSVLANRASGQYRFFQRQFWTCVKVTFQPSHFKCLFIRHRVAFFQYPGTWKLVLVLFQLCNSRVFTFQLLGNILSWHGILSDRVLRELALDGLLNRYVMLGLINSPPGMETVQKCRAVRILHCASLSRSKVE